MDHRFFLQPPKDRLPERVEDLLNFRPEELSKDQWLRGGYLISQMCQRVTDSLKRTKTTGSMVRTIERICRLVEPLQEFLNGGFVSEERQNFAEHALYQMMQVILAVLASEKSGMFARCGLNISDLKGSYLALEQTAKRMQFDWWKLDSELTETQFFHLRVLKQKYRSPVTIDLEENSRRQLSNHLGGVFAASIAAMWAMFANGLLIHYTISGTQISLQRLMTLQGSLILLAAVAAYALKDRIKDSLKSKLAANLFGSIGRKFFAMQCSEASGLSEPFGIFREDAKFVGNIQNLPTKLRNIISQTYSLKENAEGLLALCFFQSFQASKRRPNMIGKKDYLQHLMRFNLGKFLRYLDTPSAHIWGKDSEGEPVRLPVPKHYFLDILVEVLNGEERDFLTARVTISKSGIVKVTSHSLLELQSDGEHVAA